MNNNPETARTPLDLDALEQQTQWLSNPQRDGFRALIAQLRAAREVVEAARRTLIASQFELCHSSEQAEFPAEYAGLSAALAALDRLTTSEDKG